MNKVNKLEKRIKILYLKNKKKLPFHGWKHINFVREKALYFSEELDANLYLVESASLVHDLNYVLKAGTKPKYAKNYRKRILLDLEYSILDIEKIEKIISEAHTATRSEIISNEGKALSDADTLYKALPITPVIFASMYMKENDISLRRLAEKIIQEQIPLMNSDIYFYTNIAKNKYDKWAKTNLELWGNILEFSSEEQDVFNYLVNNNE